MSANKTTSTFRSRLMAAAAAIALATAQVLPASALPYPDFATPPANDNSTHVATTSFVGSAIATLKTYVLALLQQNYTLQVPSAAALSQLAGFTGVVVKRADVDAAYAYTSAACYKPPGASVAGDGGASIVAPGNGCWQLVANDKPLSVKIWNLVDDATGATGVGSDNNNITVNGDTYDGANAAAGYAAALGRSLYWPGNKYRLTKPLAVSQGVTMFGDGCFPNQAAGSTLYFDQTGKGVSLTGNGLSKLRELCTLRNQPTPSSTANTAWAPNALDYDIYSSGQDLEIDNVYTTNATKQLYIAGARLINKGLRGESFQIGIYIDNSQDTDDVGAYRQWPYWSSQFSANAQANVGTYQKANLDMIHLGRADNPFIHHIFGINANHCITFNNSQVNAGLGGPNKVHISDVDCDISGGGSIWYNDANSTAALIENVTGQQGKSILEFSTNATLNQVQLVNMRGTLTQSSAIIMPPNNSNQVFASGLMIDGFAQDGSTSPAVSVGANNQFTLQDLNPIIYQRGSGFANTSGTGVSSTWFGGTKYVIAQGTAGQIWGGQFVGSGAYTISGGLNGPIAEVLVSGGGDTFAAQTSTTFAVVSPNPSGGGAASDAGALANTPSGKIGLYFLAGTGYRFVNNTGATANITWREKRMGPQQ